MKKLILLLLIFTGIFTGLRAQDDDKRAEKIQALKIAFITQKLDLTSDEAQKFWPVYSSYEAEMKQMMKDRQPDNVLDNDEKILNIRKKFRPEFVKIIGQPRMNKLFNAEREFRGVLVRHLKNKGHTPQRPMPQRRKK